MQNQKRLEFMRNLLVLAALVGLVLLSWLLGHILRFSLPTLWHPPVQETNPQIRVSGEFESEGFRRFVKLPEWAPGSLPAQPQRSEIWSMQPGKCAGYTYYTSLPAKCRTADGKLVEAGDRLRDIIMIPGK